MCVLYDINIVMDYSAYLISNKLHFFESIKESIKPVELKYFDGTGYSSFSKLVNSCVEAAPTEVVIMMSDKVLPTEENVSKLLNLIDQGYGLVGLYRFAFFGFKKELFRTVGPLDERFVGGGFEDDDYYIRLKEANISMYITEEVMYEKRTSSWSYSQSKTHFINKWIPNFDADIKMHHNKIERLLPEEIYNYNLGPKSGERFLDWKSTVCPPSKGRKYTKGI